nr:acetyl-CoA carboxylase biotin carboxyl carrier protein subunit [uncultured Shinella sp.]
MTEELVETLLRSLQGSDVTEMEYEANGLRIRLVRAPAVAKAAPPRSDTKRPDIPAAVPASGVPEVGKRFICANMHGTFYRATAPGEQPLVEIGQTVEAGQQVAVLEAMKMMHAVEADTGGRIARVLVSDASAVEPGMPLFEIENAGDRDV